MDIKDLLPKQHQQPGFSVSTRRLVAVIPPPSPLWAVYYDQEQAGTDEEISLDPVYLLACYEDRDPNAHGEPDTVSTEIVPMILADGRFIEEDGDTVNFLGLTNKTSVSRAEWSHAIEWCIKRTERVR